MFYGDENCRCDINSCQEYVGYPVKDNHCTQLGDGLWPFTGNFMKVAFNTETKRFSANFYPIYEQGCLGEGTNHGDHFEERKCYGIPSQKIYYNFSF